MNDDLRQAAEVAFFMNATGGSSIHVHNLEGAQVRVAWSLNGVAQDSAIVSLIAADPNPKGRADVLAAISSVAMAFGLAAQNAQ
jgi:hypothetical protein